MSVEMKQNGIVDAEAFHKAVKRVKTAMNQLLEEMEKIFAPMFLADWKLALDNMNAAEKLYASNHDEEGLTICVLDEIEEIESTWEKSFVYEDGADDVDSAVAYSNRQIRDYIYELACECGYSGNYIENAILSIAKKGELIRVKTFIDRMEVEKSEWNFSCRRGAFRTDSQDEMAAALSSEGVDQYRLVMDKCGPEKIKVIKLIREITGSGLKEAKEIADSSDAEIITLPSFNHCRRIQASFSNLGASVHLEPCK